MQISVKRSGGFAGIEEEVATVDTEQLAAASAERLERLVDEIGFFDLPASVSDGEGADRFRYEVTVAADGRRHTVTYTEEGGAETASVRRLVDTVTELA
ncbi:MAG: protealysin inhibitor emfourin [Gaiellaceae bacterium]